VEGAIAAALVGRDAGGAGTVLIRAAIPKAADAIARRSEVVRAQGCLRLLPFDDVR
jgi:hypothetical protein